MRLFVPSARQAEDVRWNFVLGWADASTQSDFVVSHADSTVESKTNAEIADSRFIFCPMVARHRKLIAVVEKSMFSLPARSCETFSYRFSSAAAM
jgi:hypothetical protein